MATLGESLLPRTRALLDQGQPWYSPRVGLASIMDQASLPGRAYASLGRPQAEAFSDAVARTGPAFEKYGTSVASPYYQAGGDEFSETVLRDPTLLPTLGASLIARQLGRAGKAVVEGVSAASASGADQYSREGAVSPLGMMLAAGMGAAPQVMPRAPGARASMISPEERAANFRNWFGDSKVVDRAGSPITMYHGTNADFSEFKPLQHFGTQKAAHDRLSDVGGRSESIMPVHIRAENPLWIDDNGLQTPFEIAISANRSGADLDINRYINDYVEALDEKEFAGISKRLAYGDDVLSRDDVSEILRNYSDDPQELVSKISRWGDPREGDYFGDLSGISQDVSDDLSRNWDALAYSNAVEDKGNISYIPLSPTQIKSATGNRGTFDPNDPNITHLNASKPAPRAAAPLQALGSRLAAGAQQAALRKYLSDDRPQGDTYFTRAR